MSQWVKIQDTLVDTDAFALFGIRLRYNEEKMDFQFVVMGMRTAHPNAVDIALYETRPEAVEAFDFLAELKEST